MATLKKKKKAPLTIQVQCVIPWISPSIFVCIFCYQRILLSLGCNSLLKQPSEIGRLYYLPVNKQKQMCKHWRETFLTFLSSFDSQMLQGHWYNLVIPWAFLQIYSSPHNDWDLFKHFLLFTHWNYIPYTPTRTVKWSMEINLWSYVYSAFSYL